MAPDAGPPPPEATVAEAPPPDPAPPPSGPHATVASPPAASSRWRGKPVLYPNVYVWLVLVSSLDVMLTWTILHLGGYEANPLAARVIEEYDLWGMVSFKFFLVIVFLLACEFVGRRRPQTGRVMAYVALTISAAPVAVGVVLLTQV